MNACGWGSTGALLMTHNSSKVWLGSTPLYLCDRLFCTLLVRHRLEFPQLSSSDYVALLSASFPCLQSTLIRRRLL